MKKAEPYIRSFLIAIIIGCVACVLVMKVFHMVVVTGHSMQPTYNDGDILLCTKGYDEDSLGRGDIIVFRYGYKPCVKRIIGLPGDTVAVKDGQYVVNGELLLYDPTNEPYVPMEDAGILTNGSVTLLPSEYFCSGDNRNASTDSREIGPIPYEQIYLKVVRRLFK